MTISGGTMETNLEPANSQQLSVGPVVSRFTLRDGVAIGFRHFWLILTSFIVVFSAVAIITMMIPSTYQAEAKILVKRDRTDQVLSVDQNTQIIDQDLSETDLNSEVELIKSRDLLAKVAVEAGLQKQSGPSTLGSIKSSVLSLLNKVGVHLQRNNASEEMVILRAARELERNLSVEPVKKTKLIQVTYKSQDPQLAAQVLQVLVRLYFEKHLAVHRQAGALDFFQEQTQQYRQQLAAAEQGLEQFSNKKGVVAVPLEKEITVRQVNEFEAELQKTRAAIAETEQRIKLLTEQEKISPARLTTQVKTSDNPLLLQQLKSTLLSLELERTKLLSKFTPDYRPVQDVEAQIQQAKDALTNAESNPVREETTDRDTTYEWVKGELVKARADLTALQARLVATTQMVSAYRDQARQLNQTEIVQQDLLRSAKTAEENYLLYSRKQEEARISDALDEQRIVNVSVAEEATVPSIPSGPNRALNLGLGLALAIVVSLGIALATDFLDHSFRTPDEVEVFLQAPVLAALPRN
jgi:uncharacterized protein involved in exopolysaccharide biosynthesis